MKKPSVFVTGLLIVLGVVWLIRNTVGWQGVLYFTAFSLGPLLFNLVPAFLFRSRAAQGIILFASLAYAAWLIFVWYQAFVLHPDPQSPIALVFAGLYAMPIMMLFWLAPMIRSGGPSGSRSDVRRCEWISPTA